MYNNLLSVRFNLKINVRDRRNFLAINVFTKVIRKFENNNISCMFSLHEKIMFHTYVHKLTILFFIRER